MTDKPTITQADREAAWFIRPDCFSKEEYVNWRLGVYDGSRSIQALAKHRESSVAELQAENERLYKSGKKLLKAKAKESTEAKLWFKKAQEWKSENERLREALRAIMDMPGEINPSNYDDHDVDALNNAHIETYNICKAALAQKEPKI